MFQKINYLYLQVKNQMKYHIGVMIVLKKEWLNDLTESDES